MMRVLRQPVRSLERRDLRLVLAGGGTGGHIQPGLHLLENLRSWGAEAPFRLSDLLWFGTGRAVETRAFRGLTEQLGEASFERANLDLEPAGGGAPSLRGLSLRTLPAVQAARRALRAHRSEVVLGLGGFTCLPVVLAARSLGIPVALLEINAVRGRATRWLAPLSKRVFHAWPATLPDGRGHNSRDCWTGPPLATRFHAGRPGPELRASRLTALGFDPARPLLVVLGGSQGAGGLNDFIAQQQGVFLEHGIQLLHQAGPGKLDVRLALLAQQPGVQVVEYASDVASALEAADLVLCRGGASTLAEVCGLARPSVVVPYPHHADQHQAVNARQLGAGARLVLEGDLGETTARELCRLIGGDGKATRESMTTALEGRFPFDRPGQRILEELSRIALSSKGGPTATNKSDESRASGDLRPAQDRLE